MSLLVEMIVRKQKSPEKVEALWNAKNPFVSHYYTIYSLLVPESENYILRSSNYFYKESKYKEQLKKCFAQEGNHSQIHAQFAKSFKKLGYNIDGFLKLYRRISYSIPEKYCSIKFNLAGAAALEQLNTAIAVVSLQRPELEEGERETLRMLKWHFLEEIEHREVIFNLMVENKLGYVMRSYIVFNIFLGFCIWMPIGAAILGMQDEQAKKLVFWWQGLKYSLLMTFNFLKASIRFCLPKYNPRDEFLPPEYYRLQEEF